MDMLSVPTNHTLYKEHPINPELQAQLSMPIPLPVLQHNDTSTLHQLGLTPVMPNMENSDMKLKSEFVDEESNNGPLDFSLHRIQDIVFNNRSNNGTPRRSKVPRVKLTLRETSEQRERRLQKGRERMRNLRANETQEERDVRLVKARKCQERRRQKERELESSEERELRLSKARDRTRLRREQETPEQREKRLKTTRDRLRYKRLSESFEERQRRLFLQRQRKKEKYHKMTPEEKEMLRLNERHSKQYKMDPTQERRQTRGICIKYDTFEDDLDEALLKIQNEAQHMTNDSEDGSWLAEPEVCLSVGSLESYSPEKNNTGTNGPVHSRENGDATVQGTNKKNNSNTANETSSPSPATSISTTSLAESAKSSSSTTESTTTTAPTTASVPRPQDLQEQLSQHISNVALNISDTNKPSYEETSNYPKMNSCYPPMLTNSHGNDSYSPYPCNNNQSEYMKENSSSNCVPVSAPNYNVYHGGGAVRENNRYQYLSQGYPQPPQPDNNQPPNESYPNRNHPVYPPQASQQPVTHQSVNHHSNYSDHEAPLNLQQHHNQMLPRYGTGVSCTTEMRN